MIACTDQIGSSIILEKIPKRIISLVPSQTELLHDLGLGDRVIGITKFCVHPTEWHRSKQRIGGTKDVDIEKVTQLMPDLIIGNKEENTKKDIQQLQKIAPTWVSDIHTLSDSIEMIAQISELCQKQAIGKQVNAKIVHNFEQLQPSQGSEKVIYLIWKKPYMGVGTSTFIDDMLTNQLGFINALGDQERYPVVDLKKAYDIDWVLLSSEPYPFKEKHFAEVRAVFPNAKIRLVDGEYFTWYGSRLIETPLYFKKLLNEMDM
jgi:ABC-type Fe3+-hydroxamate transport system substrate-binding protein